MDRGLEGYGHEERDKDHEQQIGKRGNQPDHAGQGQDHAGDSQRAASKQPTVGKFGLGRHWP